MRTLKKTLSLVLALVLCLGLVGTAFAGNFDKYTDAETVGAAYKEAVDVLMGIGVVDGMSATEINPTGTYTRAQAAKIVAYMKLGTVAAAKLSAEKAPFNDVPADHWAAGYIDYCVQAGIIKGYGDGNFGPNDALTGYAFGAMLLRAVGYGVNGEYDGAGYSIKVAQDAIPLRIYAGDLGAAVNQPIERQQAMLMAFNTLTKVACVKWSTLLGAYVNLDYDITGTASALEDRLLANNFGLICSGEYDAAGRLVGDTVVAQTVKGVVYAGFAAEVVGTEQLDPQILTDAPYSLIGRTAYVWYQIVEGKAVVLSDLYFTDTVLATVSNGTTYANLTNKLLPTFVAEDDSAVFYTNGTTTGASAADVVRGAEAQLIDNNFDGKVDVVIVAKKTVAVIGVNGVRYNSNKTSAIVDGVVNAYTSVKKLDNFADLKFGDVVLYYKDIAGVYHFEKLEALKSQLTETNISYNSSTGETELSYLIGGTSYLKSGIAVSGLDITAEGYNKDVNYYFDNFGYVVYAKAVSAAVSDFVIILDLGTEFGGVFGKNTPYAQILKMDGTVEAVKLASIAGTALYATDDNAKAVATNKEGTTDATTSNYSGRFYTYTVDPKTGAYAFVLAGEAPTARYNQGYKATAAGNEVKNNVSAISYTPDSGTATVWYANTSTVYIYPTAIPGVYTTVTGVANAPTNVAGNAINVLATDLGNVAKYVFINKAPSVQAVGGNIFIVNPNFWIEVGANAAAKVPEHRLYQAIVNGELTQVKVLPKMYQGNTNVATETVITAAGFYKPTYSDGYVWDVDTTSMPTAQVSIGSGATDQGVLMVGGTSDTVKGYTFTDSTKVYEITVSTTTKLATLNPNVVTVADIATDINDTIFVVANKVVTTQADAVYIIKVAEPTAKIEVSGTTATLTAPDVTNAGKEVQWYVNGVAKGTADTQTVASGDVVSVVVTYTNNTTGATFVAEATKTVA